MSYTPGKRQSVHYAKVAALKPKGTETPAANSTALPKAAVPSAANTGPNEYRSIVNINSVPSSFSSFNALKQHLSKNPEGGLARTLLALMIYAYGGPNSSHS